MNDAATLAPESPLREAVQLFSASSSILKSTNAEFDSFDFRDIRQLLETAEYFYNETSDKVQYFTLDADEVNALIAELLELNFKLQLKSVFEWRLNGSSIPFYTFNGMIKDVFVYLFYGCGTEALKIYIDKSLSKLSLRDFEELNVLFNISGPTIKEILRPYLMLNKVRIYE